MEALRFDRSNSPNSTITANTTTKTTPADVPLTAIVNSAEEFAVKSAVKRLLFANPAFRTWLQHLIMPKPIEFNESNTDPTPAEALQMADKGRKSRKTTDGAVATSTKEPAKQSNTAKQSPIRPAGSKRRQQQSPQSSPAKSNHITDINTAEDGADVSLTPLKLEEKLKLLQGATNLTPYQASHIVGDKEWKGEMIFHDDILCVLTQEGGALYGEQYYAFEKQEELSMVNLDLIKTELCKRASKCKEPSSSKFHHSNGPFYIKCDGLEIRIYNKSEKQVIILPYGKYGLGTGEYKFDLTDSFTHETLCRSNLSGLIELLDGLRKGVAPVALLADPANAPFSFSKVDASTISLSSSLGVIATLDLSKLTAPTQEAGADPTSTKSKIRFGTTDVRGFNKNDTPAAASKNSFGVLGDKEGGEEVAPEPEAQPNNPTSAPKVPAQKAVPSAKKKSVDEMSEQEIEDVLSESSQESQSKRHRIRRHSSKRKTRKSSKAGQSKKESFMELTDYDSEDDASGGASDDDGSNGEEDSASGSGSGELSDSSDMETDLNQVVPEVGKEGIRISTKSFGGFNDPAPAPGSSVSSDKSEKEPLPFGMVSDKDEWMDNSTGSGSGSDKDDEIPRANLVDRVPATPDARRAGSTATTDMSTITGVTDPSELFPNNEGKYLFAFTIHLVPNRKHKEVLIEKIKVLFEYLKGLVPDIVILPKTQSHDGSALPVIASTDNPHFPSNYGEFKPYGWVNNAYVLSQAEVDAPTLANRRAIRNNKKNNKPKPGGKRANLKKRSSDSGADDNGLVELYVNLSFMTKHNDVADLAQSVNIDLGPDEGIYANLKTVQCWKSDAKSILVCANNQLCPEGVKSTLRETLKTIRQKLCRRGKLDATEWYDRSIPEFHIYTRRMRPQRGIPEAERAELAFDPYPPNTQFAYYIEASNEAWVELDPLIDECVDSNYICKAFGPHAFFVRNPDGVKISVDAAREFHTAARKHMGTQLLTTPFSCGHVNFWEHPVRVKMAEQEVFDSSGKPTGRFATPVAPYKRTSLRNELQDITINGTQVFHTAIVTEKGPETGYSTVIVAADPSNPYTPAIREFARNTLAHLPAFFHHYLRKVKGFHESTVKRLMDCFYIESAATAEHSSWDPIRMKATPDFTTRKARWHSETAHLDVKRKSSTPRVESSGPAYLGNSPIELTDDVRKDLLRKLRVDPDKLGPEHGKEGASVLSGGTDGTGGTSVNTNNMARKSHDLALKLADEIRQKAELAAAKAAMEAEISKLKEMIQQGAPHLSGSDVPPSEIDRGGGMSQG